MFYGLGQDTLFARLEPADAGVAAEPGLLAAGEAAGGLDRLVAGLVRGQLAVQVAEHLLVAQGAAGGPAVPQPAADEVLHLGLEARLPHAVDPGGDPLVEFGAGQGEADLDGGADLLEGGHAGGERAAGQLDHLQGPDDPAAVAGQDGGGRGRVEPGQPGVQLGRAQLGELGLEADAGTVVRSGKIEIVESGTDVQA
jgi:hypothetical protein